MGIKGFDEFLNESKNDCDNVETIKDVNKMYDYKDTNYDPKDNDRKWVSCGQGTDDEDDDGELIPKYREYFSDFDESFIANIMCEACKYHKSKSKPGKQVSWEEFYKTMKRIASNIKEPDYLLNNVDDLIKILDSRIKWHEERNK